MSKRNKSKNQPKSSLPNNERVSNNKTITMTEEQLERAIKMGVKTALRELRDEKDLPGNGVDELNEAPATFTSLCIISAVFFVVILLISLIGIITCISIICQEGCSFGAIMVMLISVIITFFSGFSIYEIWTTKKIVVIQTVFSAIMAISSLIVAIVGAYFTYKSTK